MTRRPFNPDLVRPPSPPPASPPASRARPMSVSEVAGLIRTALADHAPQKLRVVGEVSNFSHRQHWFFSLKDAQASLRCVCFASTIRRLRCRIEDGMQVVATGRLDFYDAQGHVQLYVDAIEPVGQGPLELQLRRLLEELRQLGYFEESRKKPLPLLPRRVAVVTSRTAAALQDVINTAQRRWPGCRLLLYDVKVQGEEAAPQIADAIDRLSRHGRRLGIDAILLTRGGGSIEDLWAFNDRRVADALYRCTLPVVAAIGHETDLTVAELVADLRCSTPTQAAMRLIPDRQALLQQLHHLTNRLQQELLRQIRHDRQRLLACQRHALFRRPRSLLEQARQRLEAQHDHLNKALPHRLRLVSETLAAYALRLTHAGPRAVKDRRLRLEATQRHLEAVNPASILQRGYSYTQGPDGRVLRNPSDVQPGDPITTTLAQGKIHSRVEAGPSSPQTSPAVASPAPRRRAKAARPSDPTLFG